MTDDLNDVRSNDRAAPTDANPKNLELAPPQSDSTFLPAVRIEPPTARWKLFQPVLF